jgi:hypothetical protein
LLSGWHEEPCGFGFPYSLRVYPENPRISE